MPVFTGRITVSKLPAHLINESTAQKYLEGSPQVPEKAPPALSASVSKENVKKGLVF